MSDASPGWYEENQRRLMAAVGKVRAVMEGLPGHDETPVDFGSQDQPSALETLCVTFGLTAFERSVLLLCAGVELDSKLAALCASRPTFSMALAAFAEAHWSA